jgi:hypothetical protein
VNFSYNASSTAGVEQDWSVFTRLSLFFDSLSYHNGNKAYEMYQHLSSMSPQPLKIRIKASYIYDMNDVITMAG